MHRRVIIAAIGSAVILLLVAATAYAASPHGGYSSSTNFCIQCHEVHNAQGDYVLTRESTVTGLCGTCHGVFGQSADGVWTQPPIDTRDPHSPPATMNATVSQYTAYEVDMSGMSADEMDGVPGHSLGVMYNNAVVRDDDSIPGGSNILRVMTSAQYGAPRAYHEGEDGMPRYSGEAATAFQGTNGLYCASCHTAHGTMNDDTLANNWGQQFVELGVRYPVGSSKLLSSKPNHTNTPVATYNDFCQACHDTYAELPADNGAHNHPPFCVSCHGTPKENTSSKDFPHTSSNPYLIKSQGDDLCTGCHTKGTLP